MLYAESEKHYVQFQLLKHYQEKNHRLLSLYNTPQYNTDLDIIRHVATPKYFYHRILQSNYRKITISWSFPYNSFVKLSLYNNSLITQFIPMDQKHSVMKDCTVICHHICIKLLKRHLNIVLKN